MLRVFCYCMKVPGTNQRGLVIVALDEKRSTQSVCLPDAVALVFLWRASVSDI